VNEILEAFILKFELVIYRCFQLIYDTMSRSINDINAKIAYLTNKGSGPLLKTKRPLVVKNNPHGLRFQRSDGKFSFHGLLKMK